jgi:hypothetical protein
VRNATTPGSIPQHTSTRAGDAASLTLNQNVTVGAGERICVGYNARGVRVQYGKPGAKVLVRHNLIDTPELTVAQTDTVYTNQNAVGCHVVVENNTMLINNTDPSGHSDGVQCYQDGTVTIAHNFIAHPKGGGHNHGIIVQDVIGGGQVDIYDNTIYMAYGGPDAPTETAIFRGNKDGAEHHNTGVVKARRNVIYGGYSALTCYADPGAAALPAGDEFKDNICYMIPETVAPYLLQSGEMPVPGNIDGNVVYNPKGPIVAEIGGVAKTWAEWQAAGYDAHGVNIDPATPKEIIPALFNPLARRAS